MAKTKKKLEVPEEPLEEKVEAVEEEPKSTMEITQLTRYQVRNLLFRQRDGRLESKNKRLADMIWKMVSDQLRPGENLTHFTFDWDVSPWQPMKVIRQDDWREMKKAKYSTRYAQLLEICEGNVTDADSLIKGMRVVEEEHLFTKQG